MTVRKFEEWTIAYRRKNGDGTLLPDDRETPFLTVKNTWRYWCADPHLFDREGRTYLFAELYDRVLRRGVIGCCEITDRGCTPWKVVLKMPWHLSYPHVFSCGDKIYMIPESYVGEEIALYEAVSFPEKWVKAKTLKSDYVAVDSTVFTCGGRTWLQTLQLLDGHEYFRLFAVENGELAERALQIAADDPNVRPGGKLFRYRGKLLRPAQDCTESYGCALNFYEVTAVSCEKYEEHLLTKVRPEELRSDFPKPPQGIHTYNCSEKYEVIDLKSYETDRLFYVMRPIWFIWRRVKRAFGKEK